MNHAEAKKLGCDCDNCPLAKKSLGGPIGEELNEPSRTPLIVTDIPGPEDVEHDRPLVGESGVYLLNAALSQGFNRPDFSYSSVLLCRPPTGDLSRYRRDIKNRNKKLKKKHDLALQAWEKEIKTLKLSKGSTTKLPASPKPPDLWNDPITCCAKRFASQTNQYRFIMPLGAVALSAVMKALGGGNDELSIMEYRGAPLVLDEKGFLLSEWREGATMVMPMLHPSFVRQVTSWTGAFRADLRRALNWWRGETEWQPFQATYNPSPATLRAFFERTEIIAYDYETTREGQLNAKWLCLGFASTTEAMVVTFKDIENGSCPYTDQQMREIEGIIKTFLQSPEKLWVAHNRIFDNVVLKRQFGMVPKRGTDTIMWHRSVESELPHSLGYVGSVFTCIDRPWKIKKTTKNQKEFMAYNAMDCVVTARVLPPLVEAVQNRKQIDIVKTDLAVQNVCMEMLENGIKIDPERRAYWDEELRRRVRHYTNAFKEFSGEDKINLRSSVQVADLIYDKWSLPVPQDGYSEKTGDPKTDAKTLMEVMFTAGIPENQKKALDALRLARRFAALRSARVARLRPPPRDGIERKEMEQDEDVRDIEKLGLEVMSSEELALQKEKAEYEESDAEKRPLLDSDWIFHPVYTPHTPSTGRISAQLVMNWPGFMRDMFVARDPQNVLIGLDADQGELRMSTNLSKAKMYVEAFLNNQDPHTLNSKLVFGKAGMPFYEAACRKALEIDPTLSGAKLDKKARKLGDAWEGMTTFGKIFVFSAQYKAQVASLYKVVRFAENKKDYTLPYSNVTLEQIQNRYDNWIGSVPEFKEWWARDLAFFRKYGFLTEPIGGRRCDFLNGENENEIANFGCQSGLAAIVNRGTIVLRDRMRAEFKGGFVPLFLTQVHDHILMECRKDQAKRAIQIMEESLNYEHPGFPVPYTFSGNIGIHKPNKKAGEEFDPVSRWCYTA